MFLSGESITHRSVLPADTAVLTFSHGQASKAMFCFYYSNTVTRASRHTFVAKKCGMPHFFAEFGVGKSVGRIRFFFRCFVDCVFLFGGLVLKRSYHIYFLSLLSLLVLTLCGCSFEGEKTSSVSVIYGSAAVLSFFLLICYCFTVKKLNGWFLLLFCSVTVVNSGYYFLSVATSLDAALTANRISYLGSVFLPLSMLMIILKTTRFQCKKWVVTLLVLLGAAVLFVAASPGYLDIYYKEVSLENVNGVSVLNKVYGNWHIIYFFYLFAYFFAMVLSTVLAIEKKRVESFSHALILIFAVMANIGVWLVEQLVKIPFEVLSISYIISELFLLGFNIIASEHERLREMLKSKAEFNTAFSAPAGSLEPAVAAEAEPAFCEEDCKQFLDGINCLTPTEKVIFDSYVAGKTTKEIMSELNIKENTLKFHNKNIYGKLGVSSRKQLIRINSKVFCVSGDQHE